jgi:hypothetical protein
VRGLHAASVTLVVVISAAMGCSSSAHHQTPRAEAGRFVPAPSQLLAECRSTAKAVGFAVPCPTRVPAALVSTAASATGCGLGFIGPGGVGGCAKSWRGWVVGSSNAGDQHLVVTASPRPLANDAKVVNGPAWYPKARVRLLGSMVINGWRMRSVYVTPATNDGSAFMDHVVLIWTVRGHTYGVGFHNVDGIQRTLALDIKLARGIRLVTPP